MDDKVAAALEQLEAEKERRIQARVDAGELVRVEKTIVLDDWEGVEEAYARALSMPVPDGEHHDYIFIRTGVPRSPVRYDPDRAPPDETGPVYKEDDRPSPLANGLTEDPPAYCAPAQDEAYVSLVLDHGDDDGDPGRIAAGWFSVENGSVVLEGLDRRLIGTQLLREGQDALTVVKRMLKKSLGDNSDFTAPIRYPKRGVA